jgi:hypothetical protein
MRRDESGNQSGQYITNNSILPSKNTRKFLHVILSWIAIFNNNSIQICPPIPSTQMNGNIQTDFVEEYLKHIY